MNATDEPHDDDDDPHDETKLNDDDENYDDQGLGIFEDGGIVKKKMIMAESL